MFQNFPFRRIAMVGSGPIDPSYADEIDAHGIVIRFNSCSNYGASGRKTDVLVVCNSGVSGKKFALESDAINPMALASAKALWLPKPLEVVIFEQRLSGERKDLSGDYGEAIIAKRAGGRPWLVFSYKTYMEAKHAVHDLGASVASQPSTGLITLFHIKRTFWWPRVTLYGFTHQGWEGHPWAIERILVDDWPCLVRG